MDDPEEVKEDASLSLPDVLASPAKRSHPIGVDLK
jgi:hypothetical protein